MKKRLTIFLCILSLAWIAFFCIRSRHNDSGTRNGPIPPMTSVKVIEALIDLGKVSSDTTVSASYHFINTGKDTLKVGFVNPDCMCTSYDLSNKVTLVGDTLAVTLRVNTKNKIGEQKLKTVVKLNTKEKLYALTLKMDVENI